jgi:hypothetical protein
MVAELVRMPGDQESGELLILDRMLSLNPCPLEVNIAATRPPLLQA